MNRLVRVMVMSALAACAAEGATAGSRATEARIGWIHGLPEDSSSTGIRLELTEILPPRPDAAGMRFAFRNNERLVRILSRLAATHHRIGRLSLVVRSDSRSSRAVIYNLTDAVVDSVAVEDSLQTVSVSFDKVVTASALTGNPGPPASAPAVQPHGTNKGWLYGLSEGNAPLEMDVLGYVPPDSAGSILVRVARGEPVSGAARLSPRSPLILVLPDRERRVYVEYKLWNATVSSAATRPGQAGREVFELRFRSSVIEAMLGEREEE